MHSSFSPIKAVGFDLDKTLYAETAAMKEAALDKMAEKILELKPELKALKAVKDKYKGEYIKRGSWSKIFKEDFGVANPAPILASCFETADILGFISKDDVLTGILKGLSKRYFLFLITGSLKNIALAKLEKLGIEPKLFSFSFFGDDPRFSSKFQPDNFKYFLSRSKYKPQEHVFVGDSIDTDIIIPKSLGMKTVFVGNAAISEADFCVNNIHEIAGLLL